MTRPCAILTALVLILAAVLAGSVFAGDLVSEVCLPEMNGPRLTQCRTFGWQDRERLTASSYDYTQLQGEGTAAGNASADAAAEAAATAGGGTTGGGATGTGAGSK